MARALESSSAERNNLPRSPSKNNEATQRCSLVEHSGRPQKSLLALPGLLSLEQYDAESEDLQQHPIHLVDKRTSLGFEESLEGTLLKAMGMIVTGPSNVAIAQMYNDHGPRELHDFSPVLSNDTEGASARSPARSSVIFSVPTRTFSKSVDSHSCDEAESLEGAATDIEELESSIIEAATEDVLQSRNDHAYGVAAYGAHTNDCDRVVGLKQSLGARTIVRDSQKMSSPRPDTGINTTLTPEIPARPNDGDDGIAQFARKESHKTPRGNLARVECLYDSDVDALGAPLGKLKSAREILRLKLLRSRRKRWRSTRILSPPAD